MLILLKALVHEKEFLYRIWDKVSIEEVNFESSWTVSFSEKRIMYIIGNNFNGLK